MSQQLRAYDTYVNVSESFDLLRLNVNGATRAAADVAVARLTVRFDAAVDYHRVNDEVQTSAAHAGRRRRRATAAAELARRVDVAVRVAAPVACRHRRHNTR